MERSYINTYTDKEIGGEKESNRKNFEQEFDQNRKMKKKLTLFKYIQIHIYCM